MAINPTFTNSPTLAKIKIGSDIYYLKDAELRSIVSAFGNATAQDVAASIAENGTGLATSAQVYEFVLNRTADLTGAMHFKAGTRAQQTDPQAGDVVIEGVIEYVYDGTAWQELGDEGVWVPKTRTIAGLDLQDDVTAAELKTALSLAALAYANTASATVTDYVTGINGADYTPAGSVTADVAASTAAATLTFTDYTPAGSVTGSVVPTGSVALSEDASGFQISGSNAASAVNFTPATENVLKAVATAAVAPSFTEGAFTAASLTQSTVTAASEGIVAAIDQSDNEMLVFSAAGTVSASSITAFSGGSKAADTFSAGSAATFDTQAVWVTGTTAEAAAQTFTGGKIAAVFTGNQSGDTITASFAGTTATNALVTGASYDKVSVSNLAFEGTAATITPSLVKGSKTMTVSPDPVS